jgi:uncharacterized oligopeptide transporter (OPT) family protein
VSPGLTFDQAVSLIGSTVGVLILVGGGLQWWMVINIKTALQEQSAQIGQQIGALADKMEEETKALREDFHELDARVRVLESRRA